MQPIVFDLTEARCVRGRGLGVGPTFQGALPLPVSRFTISGVTRDSVGAVLGACTVHLFRTADDLLFEVVTSDPTTGAFSVSAVGLAEQYYLVAYHPGSPDVAGTTLNTLTGTAA
jgi:hypothetical protein